jgi:HJR/Mrr/RecB family endonuclease
MTGSGKSPPDGIYYAGVFALIVLLIYLRLENVGLIEQLKVLLAGFLLVGTVVAVFYVAWHVRNMPTTPTAVELSRRFEEVRFMSGAQFEVFVADLFRAMGHQVVVLGGAGDQGVDVVVNPRGRRVAVQCKNYMKPANNKAVQEVFAGSKYHRCAESWVVAPAGYTRGAVDLASRTHVSLFDADSIHQWIMKVDKLEVERASEPESEDRNTSPGTTPAGEALTEARKRAVWYPHPDDPPKS